MILFLWLPLKLFTQDSIERKNAWSFSGYLKDLEWVRFDKNFSNAQATNLVHNRINVSWNPSDEWSGRLDLRNRFYWGDAG